MAFWWLDGYDKGALEVIENRCTCDQGKMFSTGLGLGEKKSNGGIDNMEFGI